MTTPGDTPWTVYIIEASDGRLYTGITTDPDRRLAQHKQGKGAKFFRGRTPKAMRYTESQPDHSSALKREMTIKRLTRSQKLALINDQPQPNNQPDPG
ncbi:GIY-YIG nuclease family protein [Simiduia agarivorans]|uniref:Excinuclease ABC subunit C domain-containing protein n=1 Tax=Simiduia agarivorans (strain DSM 21679 / JCM 13881 / BCRC 17597 / SA1) TaxID=1117647 RepID=K4KFY1_SIMAS|nr:GIY-YIG nuclease family protein [Simiduia agarivorans]AFU97989.1 Excinuclease ABC subunit C domain-containing protein [Simiduia agarivorans SA1 = DSM 21679]